MSETTTTTNNDFMATWGLDDIDLSAPVSKTFDPIPANTDVVGYLRDCKIYETKNGTDIVSLSFQVNGGEYANRYLNHSVFCNDLSTAEEWQKRSFVMDCKALGVYDLVKQSTELKQVAENIITGLTPKIDTVTYKLHVWGQRAYAGKDGSEKIQERINVIGVFNESEVNAGVENVAPVMDQADEIPF